MSELELKILPVGWSHSPLKGVVEVILGQSPASSTYNSEKQGLPFFQGKTEFGDIYPTVRKWCTEPKKIAQKEDVLVSVRAPVGPTNLAPYECAIGRGLAALRPFTNGDSRYFLYLIRRYQAELSALGTGTTFEAISGDTLKNFVVPIAPAKQQKRIVAKIEELFSHIDAGIVALNKSKQLLKQYRQSVLKAAVTGELTKQWREENKDKLEPASELLERILIERRDKWETQQMALFEAKGKVPKGNKWKEKYNEPETPTIKDVPNSWTPVTLDQITEYITSGSRGWAKYYSEGGSTFIRAQNLKHDELRLDDVAFVTLPNTAEGMRTRVKLSDVLITITGANVTKTGIVNIDIDEGYVSQHVALCRMVFPECSEYIYQYLISKEGGRKHLEAAAYGAGKPGLNLENIKTLNIPFPSLLEQVEIRRVVQKQLGKIERLQQEIETQLTKAEKTKQSILASAFSGKLTNT